MDEPRLRKSAKRGKALHIWRSLGHAGPASRAYAKWVSQREIALRSATWVANGKMTATSRLSRCGRAALSKRARWRGSPHLVQPSVAQGRHQESAQTAFSDEKRSNGLWRNLTFELSRVVLEGACRRQATEKSRRLERKVRTRTRRAQARAVRCN